MILTVDVAMAGGGSDVVLMVAEKPSIAASIATVLSGGSHSTRRKRIDVHEFPGQFRVSLPLMCTHTNT